MQKIDDSSKQCIFSIHINRIFSKMFSDRFFIKMSKFSNYIVFASKLVESLLEVLYSHVFQLQQMLQFLFLYNN